MAAKKTHCDVHDIARVPRSDGQGTRCPECFRASQERYAREVRGAKPAVRYTDGLSRQARHRAWQRLWRDWQRFTALPVERQRELVRGLG